MKKPLGITMVVFGAALAMALAGAATSSVPATAPSSPPAKELTLDLGDKVTLKAVLIPAGKFMMGSPETEKDRFVTEAQHEVTISNPFYMAVTHVTVDQFTAFSKDSGYKTDAEKEGRSNGIETKDGTINGTDAVPGRSWRNPSFDQKGDHPVVQVSWNDAQAFCEWLSKKSGKQVRLPSEAQWEYACRAGTTTAYIWGEKPEDGKGWTNAADQSLKKKLPNAPTDWNFFSWDDGFAFTSPVAQFKPNAFGLYDMTGNASQWCQDHFLLFDKQSVTDPTGPAAGPTRVYRGWSWNLYPSYCRSASRGADGPDQRNDWTGFRVVVVAGEGTTGRTGVIDTAVATVKEERIGEFSKEAGGLFNLGSDNIISPDRRHFACDVVRADQRFMIVDGKEELKYKVSGGVDFVGAEFSPDSQHFYYDVFYSGQGYPAIALDGKLIMNAGYLTFSPDGKRLAYISTQGKMARIVLDGQEGPAFRSVESPTFSPDSKRFAYLASDESRQWFAVLDGVSGPKFADWLTSPVFSPDAAHLAYETVHAVIVDGKSGPTYDTVVGVEFSSDSAHMTYAVKREAKWSFVRDGQDGPLVDEVDAQLFSPDSSHLACVIKKGTKWVVELDGQAGPELDRPSRALSYGRIEPIFSADSKHLAYWGMNGRKYLTVVDGKPLEQEARHPVFSPDSQHTAYVRPNATGRKWALVVDGKAGPEFETVYEPVFSADSKHVAVLAREGKECFAVLDGQRGPGYELIPHDWDTVPLFNADGSIRYLAVKGGVAYTVTQMPGGK